MSEWRALLGDTRVYAAANLINRMAGLALIPVYAHLLTPADFGVYAIVQAVVEVAGLFVGMGFTAAMNRYFLEHAQDAVLRSRVVSTALLGIAGVGALVTLLSPALAWLASRMFLGAGGQPLLFSVAFLGLVFTSLFEIGASTLVVSKRAGAYFVLSLAKATVLIAANLLCVVVLGWGVLGILAATAFSMAVLALGHMALILRRVGLGFSPPLARELLRFGLPLVPTGAAHAALPLIERYFLNALSGAAAVGLYALASRLTSLLQMFVAMPFSQTFTVRRVEALVAGADQSPHDRALLLLVLLMSSAALLLSALASDLLALLAAPSYGQAALAVPLLGLCQVLAALNFNIELGLHYTKQTRRLPLISLAALAMSLPANALLAGPLSFHGSALALLLTNIVRLTAAMLLNRRWGTRLIRVDWPRALGIMALSTGCALLLVRLPWPALDPLAMAAKLALAALLIAVLVATPLLDSASRRDLWSATGSR